jgi:hypothetical protein
MIVPAANAAQEFTACKNHFSPQQQIDLGDKSKQQVQKQTPVLPDSSAATQYIQRLGEKLAASAPGYKWPYNFHIADVAEINAFALPGGSIFVNLGTIQAATTEAQLAGVMAHEISHVVLQHSVCNAEKQQRVGIFSGIGQLAAGVMLGGAVGEAAGEAIGYSTNLGFLKMSRGAERQADLEGAIIAYDTGYDPAGMAQFFQTIESKYGEGGAQFMSDHPNPGNRTEYVDKEIAEFAPKPDLITTTPEFERIKKEVAGLRTYTAKDVASGVWRSQTAQQTVNTGINQSAGPKTGSVKPNLTTSGPWKPFSGEGFSLEIPTNWKTYKNEKSTMIGPQGGIARAADGAAGNVVYGLMADRYQPESGVEGMEALKALLAEVVADNPGLVPGKQKDIMVGTLKGHSTECDNPSANEGKGEHEWVVAFQQTDGTLFYLAFVAPTADFDTLRPSFERILQSLNIQP